MPQTFSEHIQDVEEAEKDNDDSSSSSSSSASSFARLKDTEDSFRQVPVLKLELYCTYCSAFSSLYLPDYQGMLWSNMA